MSYQKAKQLITKAYEQILIPTPSVRFGQWKKTDELLGGLRPNEYSIFCGPTGVGKTAFLSAMVADLAMAGVPTYVASVETGPIDFVVRMMSSIVGKNWNLGDPISVDSVMRFQTAHPTFEEVPLYLARYEDRVPNSQLLGELEHAVEHQGVRVAILDNLNFFMEVTRDAQAIVEMDRVVHETIIFCKKIPVHIICVMHPKKTEHGRVTSEFDIKGSSTAVQEAHNVLLFNRPADEVIKEFQEREDYERIKNFRELKVVKCRRRGSSVGKSAVFECYDGVKYVEASYDKFRGSRGNIAPDRTRPFI